LSFTTVTDHGLKRLSGLTQLKSLNLDARQITDAGLANLTSKDVCIHVSTIFFGLNYTFPPSSLDMVILVSQVFSKQLGIYDGFRTWNNLRGKFWISFIFW